MFTDISGNKITFKQKVQQTKETYKKYGLKSTVRFEWWSVNRGSSDVMFGIGIYSDASDKKWFKYTLEPLHSFFVKLDNAKRWIQHRTLKHHKYHIVNTGLKPGYHEVDERMFRACFALLSEYVENQLGTETWCKDNPEQDMYRGYRLHSDDIEEGDISGFPARPSTDRAAIDLYYWYKFELPRVIANYVQDLHECYDRAIKTEYEESTGFYVITDFNNTQKPKYDFEYVETLKQEKLEELIKMRGHLWT